jgi:hypothetical protein
MHSYGLCPIPGVPASLAVLEARFVLFAPFQPGGRERQQIVVQRIGERKLGARVRRALEPRMISAR